MSIRKLIIASLPAGLMFTAQAGAGEKPLPYSPTIITSATGYTHRPARDILGLNLSMTQDEARSGIEASFPGAAIVPLPVTIRMGGT